MYADSKWLPGFGSHNEVTKGSSQLFFFWVMGVGLKVPISLIMCDPGLAPLTLSSGLLAMKPSCVPI